MPAPYGYDLFIDALASALRAEGGERDRMFKAVYELTAGGGFDAALAATALPLDYYLAWEADPGVDPAAYVRYMAVDEMMQSYHFRCELSHCGAGLPPRKSPRGWARRLVLAVVDRIRAAGGDSPSLASAELAAGRKRRRPA